MENGVPTLIAVLRTWVARRLSADARHWFDEQIAKLSSAPIEKDIYLALGYATRRLGKHDLDLSREDLAAAQAARPGWDPSDWSVDQASRVAFVLASFDGDDAKFRARIEQLFRTADIGELITFYRALPLYPAPKLHVARAREGARSGMQPIFEAVAHRNPYPREQFDENAWNHMVLKALFIGSKLDPIQGLDERANPRLMRMLCDYAHERWAAARPVSPELWRCVGRFADDAALADLKRVLETGGLAERQAAALALTASTSARAKSLLAGVPELARAAAAGKPGWAALSATAQSQ
ncbi:MAG TPA: EboA domain-containing protein [Hyphomicrobiaceae bacterium]|nr:EboA domain-containing protein [Hyphomicrobiaceae bacterium]